MVMLKETNIYQYLNNEGRRLREELQVRKLQDYINERLPGDKTEAITDELEKAKKAALVEQLTRQLAEVERAIQKLKDGTYGVCDSCGRPIMPGRLEIMPQAVLCINCKQIQSKR